MPERSLLALSRPARRRWGAGVAAGAASLALILAGCGGGETPSDDTVSSSDAGADEDTTDGEQADTEGDAEEDAGTSEGVGPITDPVAFWQGVADAMAGAGSYAATVTQELPMGAGTSTSTMLAQILGDGTTNSETVTTMPAAALSGAGEGDVDMTSLLVDGVAYYQYPPELGMTEEGQWVQMDLGELFGGATSQFDPEMMASLSETTTMEIVDTPEVDGEPTRLIEYTVTGDQVADLAPGGLGEAVAGQLPDTVQYQVWVNDDDLPVRTVVDMDTLGATEIAFADYGTDVTIEAPDPADVVSMEDLTGS